MTEQREKAAAEPPLDCRVGHLPPTITMRPVSYDDGTHGVELVVTGLASEQQALAAMQHMQRMFCGGEIGEH